MATIFSGNTSGITSGERRFAQRLESHLEDDYLCWFNVPIGGRYRYPDFVILNPRRGLLVVEIKDWKIENIQSISRTSATLLTERGLVEQGNPLEQARQYAIGIKEVLERDGLLQAPADHPYRGKLAFPYGFGVALTNITRKQFEATDLGEVLPPHLVICKDEMTETVDAEQFQKRLWDMFSVRFECLLSMPQIDRIRWHLFPEIRISQGSLFSDPPPGNTVECEGEAKTHDASDSLMRVMDLQQEQLARSLGEGHRVIHGVAGSGKTLILTYRCQRLADSLEKLLRADSVHGEAEEIGRELQSAHDSGTPLKDMAVLFPAHFVGDEVATVFQKAKIPYERLEKNSASRKYKAGEDSVKIMTIHASKGLEFPVIAIAGLGFMPCRPDQAADDARLLYVAMTRATESLMMTASRTSAFVERLVEVGLAA